MSPLAAVAGMCSKQLLDPEDVDLVPAADRERGITPEEFRLIKIHMSFRELLSSLVFS